MNGERFTKQLIIPPPLDRAPNLYTAEFLENMSSEQRDLLSNMPARTAHIRVDPTFAQERQSVSKPLVLTPEIQQEPETILITNQAEKAEPSSATKWTVKGKNEKTFRFSTESRRGRVFSALISASEDEPLSNSEWRNLYAPGAEKEMRESTFSVHKAQIKQQIMAVGGEVLSTQIQKNMHGEAKHEQGYWVDGVTVTLKQKYDETTQKANLHEDKQDQSTIEEIIYQAENTREMVEHSERTLPDISDEKAVVQGELKEVTVRANRRTLHIPGYLPKAMAYLISREATRKNPISLETLERAINENRDPELEPLDPIEMREIMQKELKGSYGQVKQHPDGSFWIQGVTIEPTYEEIPPIVQHDFYEALFVPEEISDEEHQPNEQTEERITIVSIPLPEIDTMQISSDEDMTPVYTEKQKQFLAYFTLNQAKMLRIAQRVVGNREDAEQIVQEAQLKIWTNIDSYNDTGNLNSWISTVVRNKAIDVIRKNKRSITGEAYDITQSIAQYGVEDTNHHGIIQSEIAQKIKEALLELPEFDREIMERYYLKDETMDEILKHSGLKPGALKSRFYRARLKLRENESLRHLFNDEYN